MKDLIVVVGLVLTFAGAITLHLALSFGLASRVGRRRAFLAFFIPPLAPYWGLSQHMRLRATGWLACVGLYAFVRVVAAR